MHSSVMPLVDSDDAAARNRLWVARFGATFPAGVMEPDVQRRRFPRTSLYAWARVLIECEKTFSDEARGLRDARIPRPMPPGTPERF